jgi:hypothetical protein
MNLFQCWSVLCCLVLFGCRGPEPDISLAAGYSLGSFEAAPKYQYFIVSSEQQVVVSPSIELIAVDRDFIYGYRLLYSDAAFAPMPSGYFILNGRSGHVSSGLSWADLLKELPSASKSSLVPPSDFAR